MTTPCWTVGAAARLAGVTIKTLHHYDAIGLLRPSGFTEAGYRLYTAADLRRLHLIRLCRSLGLSLPEVRKALDDPKFDRRAALLHHRARLTAERATLDTLLHHIEKALHDGGPEVDMSTLFAGTLPPEQAAEAEARWGQTEAWATAQRRTARYDAATWERLRAEVQAIEAGFIALLTQGAIAESAEAAALAEAHRAHISRWFYPCSLELHLGLGELYTGDPRFTAYYDDQSPGLAAFVSAAITHNAVTRA